MDFIFKIKKNNTNTSICDNIFIVLLMETLWFEISNVETHSGNIYLLYQKYNKYKGVHFKSRNRKRCI